MIDNNAEREFMMVIRQAALMVNAHIGRNRAALGDLAIAIEAVLVIIVQHIEWKYEIKRPKINSKIDTDIIHISK